jgi:hypothetical protein
MKPSEPTLKISCQNSTLKCSKYLGKFRSLSEIQGKTSESNISPTALINLSPIGKIGSYHEALKSVSTVLKSNA